MEDKLKKKKKVVGSGVGVSPLRKERGKRSLHSAANCKELKDAVKSIISFDNIHGTKR